MLYGKLISFTFMLLDKTDQYCEINFTAYNIFYIIS